MPQSVKNLFPFSEETMRLLSRFYLILCTLFSLSISADPSGREKVLSIVAGEWVAQGMYAAARFDIAGHLLEGPKSAQELAKLTQCNEENLYRLLRMLASVGIFHEGDNRLFSNTEASELLAKDHPQSLRALTLFYSEEMSRSWGSVSDCIKKGKPAFDLVYGQPVFDYFRAHPQSAAQFNSAMKEKSKAVVSSCLQSFDFGRFNAVYDIGGGVGHFLSALMNKHSHMRGLLYDVPEVIAAARNTMNGERCNLLSGDFFHQIPQGGDAYLLKSVLHDWNDQDAERILEKCREAMPKHAKLIVIEPILTSANQQEAAKMMDVHMMVVTGGKERTVEDFKNLFDRAGFAIESITKTETEFSIIQAAPYGKYTQET
jgi:hypothetical protein